MVTYMLKLLINSKLRFFSNTRCTGEYPFRKVLDLLLSGHYLFVTDLDHHESSKDCYVLGIDNEQLFL